MDVKLKVGVLISGRGSNLQALIDATKNPDFPAKIACVISNKPDAYGLKRAFDENIKTYYIDHKNFPHRADFEDEMTTSLRAENVDLVCLAGFMRILSPHFISLWDERIINIHPSLLPRYKGLDTHKRAIEAGDHEAGCTVHIVTAELDNGPTLIQKTVPILKNDTPDILAARVLEAEHIAYPEALKMMAKRLISR